MLCMLYACVNVSMYMFIKELSVSGIGGGYYNFCSLSTALGKKLFRSLLVCVLKVLSLPEGRVVKKEFPGCEGSCWMFVALVWRRFEWMSHKFGSGEPTILSAVFTTRCKSFLSAAVQLEYHTVQQYVRTLSIVQR